MLFSRPPPCCRLAHPPGDVRFCEVRSRSHELTARYALSSVQLARIAFTLNIRRLRPVSCPRFAVRCRTVGRPSMYKIDRPAATSPQIACLEYLSNLPWSETDREDRHVAILPQLMNIVRVMVQDDPANIRCRCGACDLRNPVPLAGSNMIASGRDAAGPWISAATAGSVSPRRCWHGRS